MNHPRIPARCVLLDWDGTLLDSYDADFRAYLSMFRSLGVAWGAEELARHYSPDWYRVFRAAGLPRSEWDRADRLWRRAYSRENPQLLPGTRRVLRKLYPAYVLGLVTSGNRRRVRRQLTGFGLAHYFSACVCSEDASPKKPHPAPLKIALRQLALPPSVCAYVGDAPEDIVMARRAGVHAIEVRGPFPTAERVRAADPDALLDSIVELPRYLRTAPHS